MRFERKHAEIFLVAAAAIAATLVRLQSLGSSLPWVDEAYSVHLARLEFPQLLERLLLESTPPLYYALLGGWIRVFGESPSALRSLSVLFGLLGVWCVGRVTLRHVSRRAALIAVWLLALSPLHVYYSQEARMYALLALLATALAGCGLRYLKTRSMAALAAFAGCALALLLTHNVALWIVIGACVVLALEAPDRRARGAVLAATALVFLAYLPWLTVLAQQVGSQATVLDWFVPLWRAKAPPLHLLDSLASFSFGPFPPYLALRSEWGESFPVRAAILALCVFGLYAGRRVQALRFLAASAAIALACALLYSGLAQPVYIPGRTDFYLLPFFVIVLACGIDALPTRFAPPLVAVALCALSLTVLVPYARDSERDTSQEWLTALCAQAARDDLVITTGLTFAETEYALRRFDSGATLESYPRSAREHPGYLSWQELLLQPELLEQDARALAQEAAKRARAGKRVFVIWVEHPGNGPLLEALSAALGSPPEVGPACSQSITGTTIRILRWPTVG